MKRTAIVMDSTGYIPAELLQKHNIKVVSLDVTIGEETFKEIDLSNKALFEKLAKIKGFSTTSQPSVGSFLEVFQAVKAEGYDEIVSIHLSQGISGTYTTAQMTEKLFAELPIYAYDSGSSASGLGVLALAAAQWANEGFNALEIIERLDQLKKHTKLYFIVDTLEYLQRGGRIGGAAALFGTLLQIKPILYFNAEGIIDVFDKVRSKSKAWQRVIDELEKALATNTPHRVVVIHVEALEEAKQIKEELQKKYPMHEIHLFETGPVIATHLGPGALGLAFHPWSGKRLTDE